MLVMILNLKIMSHEKKKSSEKSGISTQWISKYFIICITSNRLMMMLDKRKLEALEEEF